MGHGKLQLMAKHSEISESAVKKYTVAVLRGGNWILFWLLGIRSKGDTRNHLWDRKNLIQSNHQSTSCSEQKQMKLWIPGEGLISFREHPPLHSVPTIQVWYCLKASCQDMFMFPSFHGFYLHYKSVLQTSVTVALFFFNLLKIENNADPSWKPRTRNDPIGTLSKVENPVLFYGNFVSS